MKLVAISLAEASRMVNGNSGGDRDWHPEYPLEGTLMAARLLLGLSGFADPATPVLPDPDLPEPAPWGMYQIMITSEGRPQIVGDIGFHAPPNEFGVAEIGYGVVPALRGRGLATKACLAVIEIARREGARRLVAAVEADNAASQRVLIKAGFVEESPLHFVLELRLER